ncbi:TPA: hypothetical protein ACH3X2_011787 [Trebouxia sp. C0005]
MVHTLHIGWMPCTYSVQFGMSHPLAEPLTVGASCCLLAELSTCVAQNQYAANIADWLIAAGLPSGSEVPAGATNAPVPARAVAATRSVAATRRATAAPQPHPLQVSQLQPVEVLQLLQSARQNAATALLPPAPRAMAMVTRSSGGASLNTDLSLYQTAIQFRLHLVSHGYVSCKPDGDCGFNAASQLQCRSSHLSCSIDNLTGVGQGQQQDVRQLAANVLRTNTSLQKALCHPEVGTDVFDTWKALLPARIGQDGVC